MQLVLLGYMGSGKSTIGHHLATSLELPFIDLDDYIVSKEGLSIPDIFTSKGEIYFRKKEAAYLHELLSSNKNLVLSIGGGTPCYANNMNAIVAATSNSFYLKLSIATLATRLALEKDARPLLKNITDEGLPDFIGKHLFERSFFYSKASHNINCEDKTVAEISAEIESKLI